MSTSEVIYVPNIEAPVDLPSGLVLPPLRERWTKSGQAYLRELALPIFSDSSFRKIWKLHKDEFLRRGFSLRCHNGKWFLQQWLCVNDGKYCLTEIGMAKVNALDGLTISEDEQDDSLPPLPNNLEAKLLEWQTTPARQLYRALMHGAVEWGYPGAWDCSELGTGKTYQALAAALATGLQVGVICPIAVIPAWMRAFKHFGAVPRFIRNYESLRTGARDYVSFEEFESKTGEKGRRFVWNVDPKETVLLFDEAHKVKNSGTKNQALAIAAIRQRFPIICISGTLASNPTHMRATGRVVGLHLGGRGEHSSWEKFLIRNGCEGSGKTWEFVRGYRGVSIMASINRAVFPKRGARTKIEDLGDRFPETQIIAEAYETGETKAISAAFKKAQDLIRELAEQGASEGKIKMLQASAYMKAWHESAMLKVPATVEMAKQEIEEGRSVAIFVSFTDVRLKLMEELKTDCAIFGGQKQEERVVCIDDFQRGRARVIVVNIDAGGAGISLHDEHGNYPRTAIIMPTNKVDSLVQALGRVHRAGGKSKSRQIIFYAAGTTEEDICDSIRERMANITALNDGDLAPKDKF